jgi:phage protein D
MGQARAVVIGQDESLLLDREHVRRVWSTLEEPVSDGEIVQRVADEYGLQASVEPGLTAHGVSQSATPARFLMDRAEANGFELFVRQGRIHFQPPDLQGDPQPPVRIYAGDRTNCLRFAATFDGHRPDRVAFTRAASAGTGTEEHEYEPDLPLLGSQPVDSERMGLVPFTWWLDRVQGASLAEAQARAQARANEHGWKISAEGELDGVLYGHVLLTHRTVAVDGAGGVYDGTYYVDRVTHVFNADGYRQEFRFLRNGLGD